LSSKIEKFSGEGAQPPPQTSPPVGRGTPYPPQRLWRLDYGARPRPQGRLPKIQANLVLPPPQMNHDRYAYALMAGKYRGFVPCCGNCRDISTRRLSIGCALQLCCCCGCGVSCSIAGFTSASCGAQLWLIRRRAPAPRMTHGHLPQPVRYDTIQYYYDTTRVLHGTTLS